MPKKKQPKPTKNTNQYFAGFSALILITNSVIYSLDYLKMQQDLIATVGIYTNISFIVVAVLLFFYVRKTTLETETAFAKINQANNTYSDQWMVDNISQILSIKDDQGRWLVASSSFLKLLHIDPDDYQGKTDNELCAQSPQFKQVLLSNYRHDESAWEKREPVSRITDLPGKVDNVTIRLTKTPIYDAQGNRFKLITSGSDITMGEQQQNALKLAASVFQQSRKCLFILDLKFKVLQINGALSNLTGFKNYKVKGQSLSFFNKKEFNEPLLQNIRDQIQLQQFWEGEFFCERKDSALFSAQMNIAPVTSRSKGNIKHYIGILTEIPDPSSASNNESSQNPHYDSLTNLPNRSAFLKQLDLELVNAQYQKSRTVLLFINLDKFKSINVQRGHNVGDNLLQEVAKRLSKTMRDTDVVARLGGDEFGVLVKNINSYGSSTHKVASTIAEKILEILSAAFNLKDIEVFEEKEVFEEIEVFENIETLISASIGIAIYPEDGSTSASLLRHADISMNSAKEKGGNNYQFFNKEDITNIES